MTVPTIIPTMRCHDTRSMVDWLCQAFGFEQHMLATADGGQIVHAQLTFGNGMIMLGPTGDDEFGTLMAPLTDREAAVSQSPYIIVADVDAHHARALQAGAVVVMPPVDQDYGGRGYSCRDPEGNLWNFGSYDPWVLH